jgi:hypothetical protein
MPVEINEDELYAELSKLPDFECMPIPISWYKKYGIPPRTIQTTREFLETRYTISQQFANKDLPPIIIDKPQQNGKLVEMLPPEDIKVETIQREFKTEENFPVVLPSLRELPEVD